MKKIFALMTAAALSFALAACGSGQTKPEADQTLISQPESTSSVSKIPVGVSEIPIGVSDKVNKAGLTSGKLNPATFPGKIRAAFTPPATAFWYFPTSFIYTTRNRIPFSLAPLPLRSS